MNILTKTRNKPWTKKKNWLALQASLQFPYQLKQVGPLEGSVMDVLNTSYLLFLGGLTIGSPLLVGFVLNRQMLLRDGARQQQIEQVHTLVNSQKTTLEQELAVAVAEIAELKAQLLVALRKITELEARSAQQGDTPASP